MIRQVMPEFREKENVIILCDSWYVKQNLVSIVDEYENLDLIGNARSDSLTYYLPPSPTGRKGRPPKHGRRLSIYEDFTLSMGKTGDNYTGSRRVMTSIFGARQVQTYVTFHIKKKYFHNIGMSAYRNPSLHSVSRYGSRYFM